MLTPTTALPTFGGLTTSAPFVVALMIFYAGVVKGSRILEIGTGLDKRLCFLKWAHMYSQSRSTAPWRRLLLRFFLALATRPNRRSTVSRANLRGVTMNSGESFPGAATSRYSGGMGWKGSPPGCPLMPLSPQRRWQGWITCVHLLHSSPQMMDGWSRRSDLGMTRP